MLRVLNIFFILSFFSLDLWAQECQIYLDSDTENLVVETQSKSQAYVDVAVPERFRPRLKIPFNKEAEVLRNYIISQSERLDIHSLDLISKWLRLNSVSHIKEDTSIVILPGDESA